MPRTRPAAPAPPSRDRKQALLAEEARSRWTQAAEWGGAALLVVGLHLGGAFFLTRPRIPEAVPVERCDWGRILSLGEQQRIAFARILATRPRYVFLDEATSALGPETEQLLYGQLRRTGATVVSVAHRPSLTAHDDRVLRLSSTGWSVEPLEPEAGGGRDDRLGHRDDAQGAPVDARAGRSVAGMA